MLNAFTFGISPLVVGSNTFNILGVSGLVAMMRFKPAESRTR